MKTRILNRLSIATLVASVGAASAATITVNTADNADFSAGKTNLVYALTNINDGDTIAFNIPGTGPHYLQTPVNGYPILIKDRVTLDGYTQPGASPNTNPITTSNNAVIKIVLDSRNNNFRDMEYTLFTLANSSPPIDNTSMATERGGYGAPERAVLGIYRATNVTIRGLAFLGTFDPGAYGIAVAHDYGLDTSVKDRLAYDAGSSRNCHINGCWFGIDPTNQTVAGLAPFQDAIAFFRHRDISGGPRPELPNESLLIGVKAGSTNPRAEFNVFAYNFYCIAGEAVRTRFSGNFVGVFPDGVTPTGVPAQFGAGLEVGRYNDTEPIVLGTDGDGVNDADEGNLFGPLENGGTVFGFYSTSDKLYLISGNRFGVGVDGTRWQNSQVVFDGFANTTKVQFGSDFNGVSDAWEGNVIYNNYPFDVVFPTPTTALPPRVLVSSVGTRVSFRGNTLVNNGLAHYGYADGSGGRLTAYTGHMGTYMQIVGPEFPSFAGNTNPIPILAATTTVKKLVGTCPLGVGEYTNIIIDVYQADLEGWTNGPAFQLGETSDGAGGFFGFAQGRQYLGSFVDNGSKDLNPTAGAFEFDISAVNADPAQLLTVTANYSADPPGTTRGRVHSSNFSAPITPTPWYPGDLASVGGTRVVPDTLLWYDAINGRYTNGGYNTAAGAAQQNLANWEPNIDVLGDSTFLIEANTFADDGLLLNQRYAVTLQPAAGGAPRLGDAFYSDYGTNYRGAINLSRQNGNPGRVAGDRRYGAVNFITGGEVSLDGFPAFQSDTRWTSNTIYNANSRYTGVQTFSLDPLTLVQTPLTKAFDAITGRTPGDPLIVGEVARFGGHLTVLDNGNMVVVADDRSGMICPVRTATIVVIRPNGSIVKETFAADCAVSEQIWANVAAFRGGFCVRFRGPDTQRWLYFYDNDGNFQGRVTQWDGTNGLNTDTGRGDGTRIASDIRSPYVYLAGKEPESGTLGQVKLAVWDSRTRAFVTKAVVSETTPSIHTLDRVNLAVDGLDRICVAYEVRPDLNVFTLQQVAARVMSFDGAKITPITSSFFVFVNNDLTGVNGLTTARMSVAMTPRQICIAARGTVNSLNNPAAGPNTNPETTLYTVINHPSPVAAPQPQITFTRSGGNLIISWNADAGLFTLQSRAALNTGSWGDVTPQPATVKVGNLHQMTLPIGSANAFLQLLRRW
jgi:hypothetical protein